MKSKILRERSSPIPPLLLHLSYVHSEERIELNPNRKEIENKLQTNIGRRG
jgi:hypothetical protein